jgi:alpha-glucosidase
MPEARFKDNIDWVAETLLPYGYNMIATDGWLGNSTVTNQNGYLLKYSDDWEHGWDYWAEYISSKNLVPGVYYNPMWILETAAASDKTIIGTDIPLSNIFDGGWVNPFKAGAREYIKGYVKYFKDMGYKFLRVDFLSWYESGPGAGAPEDASFFGTEGYVKAIQWIDEAAGDDMAVSYVMSNSYNHAEHELQYADLIRIASDTTLGNWTWLNYGSFGDERQTWQPGWNQWANPFQGFTCYADSSGRGSAALDGDFLRLPGFTGSYAEDERKTAISLFVMAGSPIALTSQYDTIGNTLPYLINPDILALKEEGFTGKPLFYNGNKFEPDESGQPDTGSRNSEQWIGQCANGDWVVGLFNRSDTPKTQSINFETVLGLTNFGVVRDIWNEEDLGFLNSYSTLLQPHACVLLRIVPNRINNVIRYEAEFAALRSGAHFNNDHSGHSANGFVDRFAVEHPDSSVVFTVYANTAGNYDISIRYSNATNDSSYAVVETSDEDGNINSTKIVTLPGSISWDEWLTRNTNVSLIQGINLVTVSRYPTNDINAFNLDCIDVIF